MNARAYYNENDKYCAAWLRNLIGANLIAPGDVDERSIVDVRADDLRGYTQCHFFAGIGGWSYAARLAGWDDARSLWTGSCPCQPFSAAGKGAAADDERHLWPAWFSLIAERRPAIVFGEQVEAAIGWGWLDAVFSDLEAEGYACGATVLPACGVGAPHIRQRLWFVADAQRRSAERRRHDMAAAASGPENEARQRERIRTDAGTSSVVSELADADGQRAGEQTEILQTRQSQYSGAGIVAGAASAGRSARGTEGVSYTARPVAAGSRTCELAFTEGEQHNGAGDAGRGRREPSNGRDTWRCEWLPCTDGKARPVEPGTFPLATGIPGRVGRLRAYGNAIVPQVAAEFICAAREAIEGRTA